MSEAHLHHTPLAGLLHCLRLPRRDARGRITTNSSRRVAGPCTQSHSSTRSQTIQPRIGICSGSTFAELDRPEWWLILRTPAGHCQHFRRWQAHSRSEGPPSYIEVHYSSRWTYVDTVYNFFVRHSRHGSPSYSDAASRLLMQYNFTRPAQFHQDPVRQDKLTE